MSFKFSETFPSKWLKPADLQGKDVSVIISSADKESVRNPNTKQEEPTPVVRFEGKDKGLVLNKTNGEILAGTFGDDSAEWVGKRVILYSSSEFIFGEKKDVIRFKLTGKDPIYDTNPTS